MILDCQFLIQNGYIAINMVEHAWLGGRNGVSLLPTL